MGSHRRMMTMSRYAMTLAAYGLCIGWVALAVAQTGGGGAGSVTPGPDAQAWEVWHSRLKSTQLPDNGCFNVKYPSTVWRKVPCVTAPPIFYNVGNGTGFSAQASGSLGWVTGSF